MDRAWFHLSSVTVGNVFIESFNGKLRNECPNLDWSESLGEDGRLIEQWCAGYNETRPHSSLGNRALAAFVAELLGVSTNPGNSRAGGKTECWVMTTAG